MADKMEKLNLDTVIWNRIHYPLVDGRPLFKRVDGAIDSGNDPWRNSKATDKWLGMVETCYNSPDNIRKVMITSEFVLVEYYRPFAGSKEPLNKILFNKVNMGSIKIDELISQAKDKNCRVDGIVQISGTGLGGIIKPWVCSNIEEIYFDHSILISPELSSICADIISQIGADISNTTLLDIYMKAGRIPVQAVERVFRAICLKGVEDVRDRFPRLKAVGFVSNLSRIYDAEYRDRRKIGLLDRLTRDLYRHTFIREYAKEKRASIWVLDDIPKLNDKFSIKDNIYCYDGDILAGYADLVSEEVGKIRTREKEEQRKLEEQDNKNTENTENTGKHSDIKSELEISLDKLGSEDRVKRYLMVVLNNIGDNKRLELFESMTLEGQKKYGKSIRG